MKTKGGLAGAAMVAVALLMIGCQPLANIGGKWNSKGEHYIKLVVDAPTAGRAISVTDYQVTSLEIEVHDPDGVVLKSIDWDAADGDATYMIPVEKTGDHEITVTHYGVHDGQSVEATESATFTIGAMVITQISIVPGSIGTISVVGGTTSATHTVSGKIIDGGTGTPLAGGIVEFAGHSATSAADGNYLIDLGQSTGTVTGAFSIRATGYITYFFEGISADASTDSTARWVMQKVDNFGLPDYSLNLHVFQSDGSVATEIPDNTRIFVSVYNENGAGNRGWVDYTTGGYQFYNHVSGTCTVAVYVDLAGAPGMHSFNVIKENVAVPGVSQDVDLYEDPGSETAMTISGDAGLNQATLYLDFPTGIFPVLDVTLDSSAQATLQFSNPHDYNGFWVQAGNPLPFAGPTSIAGSAMAPVATSVLLPALLSAGPLLPPDSGTLFYDSGTLSVSPVDGATGYNFWIMEGGTRLLGAIGSIGPSVTLPLWMQAQLAGTTPMVLPIAMVTSGLWTDITELPLLLAYGGAAPSVEVNLAMGAGSNLSF